MSDDLGIHVHRVTVESSHVDIDRGGSLDAAIAQAMFQFASVLEVYVVIDPAVLGRTEVRTYHRDRAT